MTTRLKERRTRIVATLGPATATPEGVAGLLRAGVDVVRLNLSHGDHATHAEAYAMVRRVADGHDRTVAVLADLCGPKIRTGRFPGVPVTLRADTEVTLTTRAVEGSATLVPCSHADLPTDVHPGCRVLLADGAMELQVLAIDGTEVRCRVVHGGLLGDRKGINLPDVEVSAPALTTQDRDDARFAVGLAVGLGVDLLALSFRATRAAARTAQAVSGRSGAGAGSWSPRSPTRRP